MNNIICVYAQQGSKRDIPIFVNLDNVVQISPGRDSNGNFDEYTTEFMYANGHIITFEYSFQAVCDIIRLKSLTALAVEIRK
jgi:hypothetical protein